MVSNYPSVDVVIIDGPAIVHMVQPKSNSNVDEHCKLHMKYVVNFFNKANRIDIVFDVYLESSLKERFRESRVVAPTMIIKGNTNKQSLFLSTAKYA